MMPQRDILPECDPELTTLFESAGLTLLGISGPFGSTQRETSYRQWIQEGNHGEMAYLERHQPLKYNPENLLPDCKSILITGMSYIHSGDVQNGEGRIARYAWGRDYHKVMGSRLKKLVRTLETRYPGQQFKKFTDSTPLDERFFAEQCGAGFIGRNHLLISSLFGSWFVLGGILTTCEWPPTPPASGQHGACPTGCRKCIQACPTGALDASGKMDARRCISYLTIENKGSIPEEFRKPMGDWIFGCDLCQEVCPFQLRKKETSEADFKNWKTGPGISLSDLLGMTDEQFLKHFAGSPVMRAGLRSMKRNACIAAGNTNDPASKSLLEKLAASADPLLKDHAQWALNQYTENQT